MTSGMSDIPRAVASGVELAPGANDPYVPVEPRRVAIVVGVLAALYLVAAYCVSSVPGRALALVGVPGDDIGRYGGLRMTWRPPDDLAPQELERVTADMERAADGYVVLVPHIAKDAIEQTAQRIGGTGRLELHEVLELPEMMQLAKVLELPMRGQWPLDMDVDQWRPEDGSPAHTDFFLRAKTREELQVALAQAAQRGWKLPAGARIAYEHVRGHRGDFWRTYVIAEEAALDGSAIDNAMGSFDPYTNRPIVLLDFTREGGAKFGDLTARIVGRKLATLLDDEIKSAPIINSPIRGGRASINMGGTDPREQERERDALIDTLKGGALPRGGHVLAASYVPPAETAMLRWLARAIVGIAGGLVAGGLAWLAVRVLRPHRRRVQALTGKESLAVPLAWTGLGVLILLIGSTVVLPGVNSAELDHVLRVGKERHWLDAANLSIFALGIIPIVSSAVTIEMAVWIVPRWRRLRDGGPDARRKVGLAVAIGTLVLATVQAYFIGMYMQALSRGGAELWSGGKLVRWADVATLVAGVMCLAWIASLITRRGLGNGFVVLIAGGWLLHTLDRLVDLDAPHLALVVMTIACVAAIVLAVTRWRVRGPRGVAMVIPAAGMIPLAGAGGILALVGLLASLGLPLLPERLSAFLDPFEHETIAAVALVVATALWAFALARPGRRARELERAGLVPATWDVWLRATVASALALLAIFAVTRASSRGGGVGTLVEPTSLALAIAVIADLFAEARDRRRGLVPVRQLHDPLLVDVVRDRLAGAGIEHHLQAERARTMLAAFASYTPITVLVPPDRAADAERELRELLE
jgi:hypothetical protein